MSRLNILKVFAATYVAESDLSVEDKMWLIDFIKEGERNDVLDIIEGEYQLPQITEYEAEMLNEYISEAEPPPKKKGNPLRIRSNLGTSKVISAVQKKREIEKLARRLVPDASKESVKAVKRATKPYRKEVWKAAGKAGGKIATVAGGAALVAAGAHSLYQKYMSKAAKACRGKPDREMCMAKYKKKAAASKNIFKIKKLRAEKNECVNTRNPLACQRRIDSKIKKLKEDVDVFVVNERLMGRLGVAFDVMFVFELGAMAYKRFFSKAAKTCKGAPDRRMCILRFKIKAKEAQAKTIKSKAGLCAKDANPANCKNKIMRKVQSLQSDIKMLRQEL
jgi:hypothetical protein